MKRQRAVERIFTAWNAMGIRYAVAHGVDAYPAKLGRDLDVVICKPDIEKALQAACQDLHAEGYQYVRPPNLWGKRVVGIQVDDWDAAIEIHSIRRLMWRNVLFVDTPAPSAKRGVFAIDPWVSVVKRILMPVLAGDAGRFATRAEELILTPGEEAALHHHLPQFCGTEMAAWLMHALAIQDLLGLTAQLPQLRRTFAKHSWMRAPFLSLKCVADRLWRHWRAPWLPCAPVIQLIAPKEDDILEKALETLGHGSKSFFAKIIIRRQQVPSRPQRNHCLQALARRLKDRIGTSRQQLIIYCTANHLGGIGADATFLIPTPGQIETGGSFPSPFQTVNEAVDELRRAILKTYLKMGRRWK